ncbi:hypothetical protein [Nostoc sp.]|uniref:hypothetical protein n=1 Tax=Nostoc sp. TaxID=1180 RepID=UPI002FF97ECA
MIFIITVGIQGFGRDTEKAHWCQLKAKPFSNLVSSQRLEMHLIAALPQVSECIPSLRLGTRQSLKAASRLKGG